MIDQDLQHWVNDGLMALFFFVVALEVKREFTAGDLRDRRTASSLASVDAAKIGTR